MFKYISACCLLFALVACSDKILPEQSCQDSRTDGVEISVSVPGMGRTRASDETTSIKGLDIFLFVFDGNRLLQTIRIDHTETTLDGGVVKFTASLPQTDDNAIVHVVALDDSDGEFSKQIDEVGYGIEDTVMPSFYVKDRKEAFWQRVELGVPIVYKLQDSADGLQYVDVNDVRTKLSHVTLIRNFAKVSLVNTLSNFTVLGWTIVNERDRGSVAPWYSKAGDPDIIFPEYEDEETPEKGKSYEALNALGYFGVSQAGAKLRNTLGEVGNYTATNADLWTTVVNNATTSRYLYERKSATVNPLYIIVYGRYNDTNGYYKLALGHTDNDKENPDFPELKDDEDVYNPTGLFTEYNVLRNIEYTINITAVSAVGAASAADAANGPAFNNLSGDVVTRNLLSISDGIDLLSVNYTSYVVTEKGKSFDFAYRYQTNVNNSQKKTENGKVNILGLTNGDVIKSFKKLEPGDENYDANKVTYHIEFNDPSDELKIQTFTLYSYPENPSGTIGLSRKITLVLRNKWEFLEMDTFPGLWDDDNQFPDWNDYVEDDGSKYIGSKKGDPLTIFFELPEGLPQAIFPLTFVFESDRQNIENSGINGANAVVRTGPSLFPGVYDHRISYEKTLTWEQYTDETGEASTPQTRIQRARFVTTTEVSLLPGQKYETTVVLHNDYFIDKKDTFIRDQNKNVEDPAPNS